MIFVDSSLVGGGALWQGKSFTSFKWPERVVKWNLSINDLELFNVLVSTRLWKDELRGLTARIWCDNNTSVRSLFSGRARNEFMSAILRELWYMACAGDIFLSCKHIAGCDNNEVDLLSRAYNSPKDWRKFVEWNQTATETQRQVDGRWFRYPDTI